MLDECRSFDLMQRQKLVVVENADKLVAGDNRPLIERYASAPADHSTLALKAGKWNRGNLDKLIEKVGVIVKCEPPSAADAAKWAYHRALKRHDADLDKDAAVALVERVGVDLGRIDTEIRNSRRPPGAGGPGGERPGSRPGWCASVGRTRGTGVVDPVGDRRVTRRSRWGGARDPHRAPRRWWPSCVDLVKNHSLRRVPPLPPSAPGSGDAEAFVPLASARAVALADLRTAAVGGSAEQSGLTAGDRVRGDGGAHRARRVVTGAGLRGVDFCAWSGIPGRFLPMIRGRAVRARDRRRTR